MRTVSRRGFFKPAALRLARCRWFDRSTRSRRSTNPVFRHGVASGDPLADRVILWTRVTPKSATGAQRVVVDGRRAMRKLANVVARGEVRDRRGARLHGEGRRAGPRARHDLLLPLRIGRRTFGGRPHPDAAARGRVARAPWRGVVLEPAAGLLQRLCLPRQSRRSRRGPAPRRLPLRVRERRSTATARRLGRIPSPDREMVALQDYRERHAQYKADPDSQEIHRQHPFIVVWDDHEFTNNAWSGGAQNHNPTRAKASGRPRRVAAQQAYCEWMPIREDAQTLQARIYRTFRFGDLATLFMLDTRLIGRDRAGAARGHRGDRICRRGNCSAPSRKAGWRSSWSTVGAQQDDVERARAAGDVRAANADRRDGRQPRFVGRLSRGARAACST